MVKLKAPTPANPPPPLQRTRVSKLVTPHDTAVEAKLQMPNERDESVVGAVTITADAPDPVIEQAAVDVARGLKDTSKGAELNRAYTKLK